MKVFLTSPLLLRLDAPSGNGDRMMITGCPAAGEDALREVPWVIRLMDGLDLPDDSYFELLREVTGELDFHFSLVVERQGSCFLVSDNIRSHPLFYGDAGEGAFVTDNLEGYLKEHGTPGHDPDRMEEYLLFGNVPGHHTVYGGVYGVQAAEIVCLAGGGIRRERYYHHVPPEEPMDYADLDLFTKAFDRVFQSVFTRMIRRHPGVNRWVIPLSGGHDSRMIVNYLYRLGQKNVVCFSYGTAGNEQSAVSRQVAEAAGYEWHFVEYTPRKWQELQERGVFDDYIRFAFNGTSTPHLQDLLAVDELLLKGIVKEGDIFVPGHGLDINAGYFVDQTDLACDNMEDAVRRACQCPAHLEKHAAPCSLIPSLRFTGRGTPRPRLSGST